MTRLLNVKISKCIRANSPGFSGRFLTTIYKQKTITLKIGNQVTEKLNFNFSGVKLI